MMSKSEYSQPGFDVEPLRRTGLFLEDLAARYKVSLAEARRFTERLLADEEEDACEADPFNDPYLPLPGGWRC